MQTDIIFSIAVLIMSVVIHEVSHGYAALYLGDPTAKYAGRLTINPLKHLDLFGSVILPILLVITKAGFIIGWAKPVPYNPYNVRYGRWGEALVALAGPASNFLLAFLFGLMFRLGDGLLPAPFLSLALSIVLINVVLAVFNLVPIPPLDGSKLLFAILPPQAVEIRSALERYGIFLAFIFILFLWRFLLPTMSFVFSLITGVSM